MHSLMMGEGCLGPNLFGHGLRLAQRENWAAGVREHAIDGAFARQVFEGQATRRSENNQVGMSRCSQSQNLDERIAVCDDGLDGRAASGARFLSEDAQFNHGPRVQACGHTFALHHVDGRKHVQQD